MYMFLLCATWDLDLQVWFGQGGQYQKYYIHVIGSIWFKI